MNLTSFLAGFVAGAFVIAHFIIQESVVRLRRERTVAGLPQKNDLKLACEVIAAWWEPSDPATSIKDWIGFILFYVIFSGIVVLLPFLAALYALKWLLSRVA